MNLALRLLFTFGLFRRITLLGLAGVLASGSALLARSDYVVVSATAEQAYNRVQADGSLRPESYVFSPGKHFGNTGEVSMAPEEFQSVLQALAPALAKREYWPATVPTEADLVIVVHWGETEVFQDPLADYVAENYNNAMSEYMASADEAGNADPGRLNELKRMDSMNSRDAANTLRTNAELLGFQKKLKEEEQRFFSSEDERTMKAELAENRYFLVLMAWDYAGMRAKQPPKLRWVTRMSVRSAGHNFGEASLAMISQAAPLFGEQMDDLMRKRTTIDGRKSVVEIGESTVVDETPTKQP